MWQTDINLLAVIVATIASIALGFAWYSQALFGKAWMQAMGYAPENLAEQKTNMTKMYVANLIATLVMAYIFALVNYFFGSMTAAQGMLTGFVIWLGFVSTIMLNDVLFGGKTFKLYAINAGYQLVSFILMGAILGAW